MRHHTASVATLQRIALISGLVAVASLHNVAIFALYRGRVVAHQSEFDYDLIVFLLPALLAFGAYLVLLTVMLKRIGPRFELAVLFTLLSGGASLVIAFNTYGT